MMMVCPICGAGMLTDGHWFNCPYSNVNGAYEPHTSYKVERVYQTFARDGVLLETNRFTETIPIKFRDLRPTVQHAQE